MMKNIPNEAIEAAAKEIWRGSDSEWRSRTWKSEDPYRMDVFRSEARRALRAALKSLGPISVHRPVKRWSAYGWEEHSFSTLEQLQKCLPDTPADTVMTFEVCEACAEVEKSANEHNDDWCYIAAVWPCAVARQAGETA